jgi:benzylsuccinate CoA-transferase BbsF subunit
MGQSGPLSRFAGVGTGGAAITGFYNLTGWADRPPAPLNAYTDYITPRIGLLGLMAALHERRRTGFGRVIDVCHADVACHFLAPALWAFAAEGVVAERRGNDDDDLAPHGVYPARGDDQWVALACEDDEAWASLCRLVERPELAGLGLEARLADRRRLDEVVARWTSARPRDEAVAQLQAVGVAAHRVQGSADCLADPQLAHLGHFVEAAHPVHGTTTVEGPRSRLGRTPPQAGHAGPTIGQHTEIILKGVLGYDDERITQIALAEALE